MRKGNGISVTFSVGAGKSIRQNGFGTNAYLYICSSLVNMRVSGKEYGAGTYSPFGQATGIKTPPFETVEIQNQNAFSVAVQLWIGDDDFIDNRSNCHRQIPTYRTS